MDSKVTCFKHCKIYAVIDRLLILPQLNAKPIIVVKRENEKKEREKGRERESERERERDRDREMEKREKKERERKRERERDLDRQMNDGGREEGGTNGRTD